MAEATLKFHSSVGRASSLQRYHRCFVAGDRIEGVHQTLPPYVEPSYLLHYNLNEDGRLAAKKIVCAIGFLCPDITFGPKIYPMVCMFLHYMSEETAYACMMTLLKAKHGRRITQTKMAYESAKMTLITMLKKNATSTYKQLLRICKNNPDTLSNGLDGWLWWMFKDLPFSYMVRIMDVYLCEGTKILYRVAMAICILYIKSRRMSGTFEDSSGNLLATAITQFCNNFTLPVDKLLKTSFGIRGLRRKDLNKMLLRNEMLMRSKQHIGAMRSGAIAMQRRSSLDLNMKVSPSYDRLEVNKAGHLTGQLHLIWHWMPPRITIYEPELIFTTEEHGTSITTFFDKVAGQEPTMILIKTTTNEIFGAYCSTDWEDRRRHEASTYFGTGESFLFSVWPVAKRYSWVGLTTGEMTNLTSMFLAANHSMITVGGGRGYGLYFEQTLDRGRTEACDTFGNPALCEKKDFVCKVLEVYKFA
ncbi:PREDICTED: TBC1 domain family member 24-like [Priapulus caudatus]|uniref:TBC1 domain family member 24-like n=1 Tax=Priapulus caudatus TaxID=37621 RepID=A0ABM1EID8_PRICU|nr:PREDICTED: TBC1 domain family member 24-like [Priapulus caudatus]